MPELAFLPALIDEYLQPELESEYFRKLVTANLPVTEPIAKLVSGAAIPAVVDYLHEDEVEIQTILCNP